jgi:hypothetical protein
VICRALVDFEQAAIVVEADPTPLSSGKLGKTDREGLNAGGIELDFVVATAGRMQQAANIIRKSHVR